MDLQTRKITFVQEFLRLENEEIVSGLEHLLRKKKAEEIDHLTPMSVNQLNTEIDQSMNDSVEGRLTSAKDLKKKSAQMELTVYWTQFAENKLEDIFSYYIEKESERIALRLIEEIIEKSIELEKSPLIGQKEILLADRPQEFRYLVYKNYKIIYWVNEAYQRVEIVNLFDCRQNPIKMNEI